MSLTPPNPPPPMPQKQSPSSQSSHNLQPNHNQTEERLKKLREKADESATVDLRDSKNPPSEILKDFLFLGNEHNASSLEQLQASNIKCILNLTEEIPNFFENSSTIRINYMKMNLPDDERTYLPDHLQKMFDFIDIAKSQNSAILVHCRLGVSRSASVVLAYLLKHEYPNLMITMKNIRDKRPIVKPNPSFFKQLMFLEKQWKNLEKKIFNEC